MHNEVIIDPSWNFQEAVSAASDRFRPGSLVVGKARNVLIQSWAQMVGKSRASQEVNSFINDAGSFTAAAKSLSMSTDTLKGLLDYINTLPSETSDTRPIKLRKGQKKLYELLRTKNAGDLLSRKDLRDSLGWADSTLNAYLKKNMLNEFLEQISRNSFQVLTNSSEISEPLIAASFSQIQNDWVFISRGEVFKSAFSKYVLLNRVGNGAVGHVWRVQDKNSGEFFALKVMNPRRDLLKPTVFQNVKRRFSREARNGLKLRNDHVIRYKDYGDYKAFPFLVMQLAESNLNKQLQANGKLTADESLVIMKDCLKGLIYLHKNRHVHRDLKPDNILKIGEKYVLGDLGIVKWSDFTDDFISAGTITRNDTQLGSWFYMAPEQSDNPASTTQASDIYALGVTWYETLTLDHLSPAKIASRTFDDACKIEEVNQCIRKMLDYNPSNRPSAEDLLTVVNKVRSDLQRAA
jgi:hypothetical protein